MADLNVERKQRSIWPWIVGLLLLGLIIWGLAELLDDDRDDVLEDRVEEVGMLPGSGVAAPVV